MVTLVTGATGFIGGALAAALRDHGDDVRGLVRDPDRARGVAPDGVELVTGDVTDPASLRAAVAGVDRVFHTAGLVGDWLDPRAARRVNVEGTRNLLAAADAAGVGRFVHMSSLSVLGTRHHHGTDETGAYGYGDPYTDTKVDSERVVREFRSLSDMETVCLRPGFVYGPGDRQVVPGLLDALRRRPVHVRRRRQQADEHDLHRRPRRGGDPRGRHAARPRATSTTSTTAGRRR